MGERIAKASKVPFVIRSVRLGRVAVCELFGCFIGCIEGYIDVEDALTGGSLITMTPVQSQCSSRCLLILGLLRSKEWKHSTIDDLKAPSCLIRIMLYVTEAHEYSANPVVEAF